MNLIHHPSHFDKMKSWSDKLVFYMLWHVMIGNEIDRIMVNRRNFDKK